MDVREEVGVGREGGEEVRNKRKAGSERGGKMEEGDTLEETEYPTCTTSTYEVVHYLHGCWFKMTHHNLSCVITRKIGFK